MLYTILATSFPQRNTQKRAIRKGEWWEKEVLILVEPEAQLKLIVATISGRPLTEPIDVFLFNQTLTQNLRAHCPSTPAIIKGLHASPSGRYRIEVDAACYQTVSQFIDIPSDGAGNLTIAL